MIEGPLSGPVNYQLLYHKLHTALPSLHVAI